MTMPKLKNPRTAKQIKLTMQKQYTEILDNREHLENTYGIKPVDAVIRMYQYRFRNKIFIHTTNNLRK